MCSQSQRQYLRTALLSSVRICLAFFQEKEITFIYFTFQLLQTFQKYKELIKHPNISKELLFERETLLARLQDYVKGKNVFKSI